MNDYIALLARQKSFEQLDPEARKKVLEAMNEAEYTRLRAVLLAAPALDADVAPPPGLRAALLRQFERQLPPPAPRTAWFERSVQLWQAAAAILAVLLLAICVRPETSAPARVVETVIRTTDTVFQERIVRKERVVVRYKTLPRKEDESPVALQVPWLPRDSVYENGPGNDPVSGTSIARQPELLRFFTQTNK